MFVKTTVASNYFPEAQVSSMNFGVNAYMTNTYKRDPRNRAISRGQVLFTNCTTLKKEEVNALISFEYKFGPIGEVEYFKLIEIAIFDDNDDEGVNYMLDHRKTKDELIREPALDYMASHIRGENSTSEENSFPVSDSVASAMLALHSLNSRLSKPGNMLPKVLSELRVAFTAFGNDDITGFEALEIIERIFKGIK